MQPLTQELPRVLARKMVERAEYFVARANIQPTFLKRKRVEVGAMTALPHSFGFREGQQLGPQTASPECGRYPQSLDVEPAPKHLAVDPAHNCLLARSGDEAEGLKLSIGGS